MFPDLSLSRLKASFIVCFCFTVLALIVALVVGLNPAQAQDAPPLRQFPPGVTVCRDPRFATVRLEFHHIPDDWINKVGYWYLGTGNMYERAGDNVFVADALTEYEWNELWIYPGVAVIGTSDYTYEARGDEHAALCDVTQSPVQDPDDPNPVLYPSDGIGTIQCDHRAIDGATGNDYCFVPNNDATGSTPPPPYNNPDGTVTRPPYPPGA